MANVRQKAPDALANRRGGRGRGLVVVPEGASREVPRCPDGVGPYARARWRSFWKSRESQAVAWDADGERLKRWIECVDLRHEYMKRAKEHPIIPGANGTVVRNPYWMIIRDLTREIEATENVFGMNPQSRFRLQLTYAEAGQSTAKLNAILERQEERKALAPAADVIDGEATVVTFE